MVTNASVLSTIVTVPSLIKHFFFSRLHLLMVFGMVEVDWGVFM
jgi:hypothetical protein